MRGRPGHHFIVYWNFIEFHLNFCANTRKCSEFPHNLPCNFGVVRTFENSYLGGASTLVWRFDTDLNRHKFSDIEGLERVNNDPFGLTDLATFIINYPGADNNVFDLDPKFNNAPIQDYTVQIDSPLIRAAENGVDNIGNVSFGIGVYAGVAPELTVPELRTNLEGVNDLIVGGGGDSGLIRTAAIRIPTGRLQSLGIINYIGGLFFDKDQPGGTAGENENVPDNLTFTSGNAGANPDRLGYRLRWSDQPFKPVGQGDWNNGGLAPAGSFIEAEWNTIPLIDNNGKGNGDPDFQAVTGAEIFCEWFQVEIVLRNDYVS